MNREKFLNDDRYCELSDSDMACHGGHDAAIAWLLDEDNDTSFCAVLDGDRVWTAVLDEYGDQVLDEDGRPEIQWEDLADFAG